MLYVKQNFFSDVPDFRIARGKLHLLSDILMLSLCGVLCGAEDYEDIENYGKEKLPFLKTFLSLSNGIPSQDTINRVFRYIDSAKFEQSLRRWSAELLDFMDFYQVAIDGKVLRATNPSGKKKEGLCLGQLKTAEKSNEKTAIPALIESLSLENALLSIDAIACQASIAEQIIDKKANYLLALKKNQGTIFEQLSDWFEKQKAGLEKHSWEDFGTGRIEKRVCYVCPMNPFMDSLADWKGLKSLILIEASRERKGKIEQEKRYYLSSLEQSPAFFNRAVRQHWSIENALHWQLDVCFHEDRSRIRKDQAPENMAILRKIALQGLKQVQDTQSIKSRRKIAGWNDQYLSSILQNMRF